MLPGHSFDGSYGVDTEDILASPSIDFGSLYGYLSHKFYTLLTLSFKANSSRIKSTISQRRTLLLLSRLLETVANGRRYILIRQSSKELSILGCKNVLFIIFFLGLSNQRSLLPCRLLRSATGHFSSLSMRLLPSLITFLAVRKHFLPFCLCLQCCSFQVVWKTSSTLTRSHLGREVRRISKFVFLVLFKLDLNDFYSFTEQRCRWGIRISREQPIISPILTLLTLLASGSKEVLPVTERRTRDSWPIRLVPHREHSLTMPLIQTVIWSFTATMALQVGNQLRNLLQAYPTPHPQPDLYGQFCTRVDLSTCVLLSLLSRHHGSVYFFSDPFVYRSFHWAPHRFGKFRSYGLLFRIFSTWQCPTSSPLIRPSNSSVCFFSRPLHP